MTNTPRPTSGNQAWWRDRVDHDEQLARRYGLSAERFPAVFGFDLTTEIGGTTGAPAALWVACNPVGATKLVLEDLALPYILWAEIVRGGIVDVRVAPRSEERPLTGDDLRTLPVTSSLADLAQLGETFLDLWLDSLERGEPLATAVHALAFEGRPHDALLHLIAKLHKQRLRDDHALDLRQEVVRHYRQAIAGELGEEAKRAPRVAVGKLVHKSPAHVGRLLVEARNMGLLEKTSAGRKNRPTEAQQ
jgi:hypothetical protein